MTGAVVPIGLVYYITSVSLCSLLSSLQGWTKKLLWIYNLAITFLRLFIFPFLTVQSLLQLKNYTVKYSRSVNKSRSTASVMKFKFESRGGFVITRCRLEDRV